MTTYGKETRFSPENTNRKRKSDYNNNVDISSGKVGYNFKPGMTIYSKLLTRNSVKVWDRHPADSYKNTIPEDTPLVDDSPTMMTLDRIAKGAALTRICHNLTRIFNPVFFCTPEKTPWEI